MVMQEEAKGMIMWCVSMAFSVTIEVTGVTNGLDEGHMWSQRGVLNP
jgi:hypothetical protein